MTDPYLTLEDEEISLAELNVEERRFLDELYQRFMEDINSSAFQGLLFGQFSADSIIFSHAKRLGKPVSETPLYKICDDLDKRLGIKQGYLVKEEVVKKYAKQGKPVKEFTIGQVAQMAGCEVEEVRHAIRTARLRSRRVGQYSLIREEDAEAFVKARKRNS